MRRRRLAATIAPIALAAILGGCTPDEGPVAADGWVEPGWAARARQQIEEYQVAFVACMEEHGAQAEVMIGGTVSGFAIAFDDEGREIPGVDEVLLAATDACGAAVARPEHWALPMDEAAYERMLDVRECIIAHGYEIPEAPTLEAWLEQGAGNAWNPYLHLFPGHAANPLPEDELIALLSRCPQSGHGFLSIKPQMD